MTATPAARVSHPHADFGDQTFVATESRSPVIFLNAGRVSLLGQAEVDGRRVALVTDELSRLTPAFAEVWREAGAAWVVRSPTGLREGFTGRRLTEVGEVFTVAPIRSIDDVDLRYLDPAPRDALEIMATVSLRHRPRDTTLLGGPAGRLAELVTGAAPRVWGHHEPGGVPWNREQLTSFVRAEMPGPVLVVASGPGFTASITVQRTSEGIEEITQVHASLGLPSASEFENQRAALTGYLGELAQTSMPLVGMVLARPGYADLMIRPRLALPPSPLALLIGPPGVRSLKLDVPALAQRFAALTVGRPRIPGLVFPLGGLGPEAWVRLDEILATIGREELDAVLGLPARFTTAPADLPAEPGEAARG